MVATATTAFALTPLAVWTGSTNMSQGGIFGHSNVGHEVRDPAVAGQFLTYWTELATDPAKVGTGLGLAIVKQIVEAHGGTVTAESEQGRGARFSFTIPKAPPDQVKKAGA